MKTIRELQKGMRDTAAWLEEASRDLSDLQTNREPAGGQVNFQRLQVLGERYPIMNHCLKNKTSAFQQQYLTLLAGLLLAEPAHAQDGWLLLQRIIAGGGVRLSLEELQVDAATLTPEQMDGFTTAVFQDELGNALLLDGLLLCLTIGGGQAAWDYLSGLAELIRCPAERLQKLAALASGVAERDQKKLIEALNQSWELSLPQLLPWAMDVFRGPFLFYPGPGRVWLEGDGKTQISQTLYRKISGKKVGSITIRNACFSGYPLEFFASNTGWLFLEGCKFREIEVSDGSCFSCLGFYQVELKNCQFENLSAGDNTVEIKDVKRVLASDTGFRRIKSSAYRGWTLFFSVDAVRFEHVSMEEISGGQYWYYGSGKCTAADCTYRDCHGRTSGFSSNFKKV